LAFLCAPALINANSTYDKHIFFDNSLVSSRYYYSDGDFSAPSSLILDKGKIPVDKDHFRTPPNALRLEWISAPAGTWEAEVKLNRWRNQEIAFEGDTLSFWCYSVEAIHPRELPRVQLADGAGGYTAPLPLERIAPAIPGAKWTRVSIPLKRFSNSSADQFNVRKLQNVVFLQGESDNIEHTLVVDEIRIDHAAPTPSSKLEPPQQVEAKGYELHADLTWTASRNPAIERYVIYRSVDGEDFQPIGIQQPGFNRYTDWLGVTRKTAIYKITASDRNYKESPFSSEVTASTRRLTDDELLTMVQEASFHYYWEHGHPHAGMALEDSPGDEDMVATGASGFGIMAICVGVERGFITREQALERLTKIVAFLEKADRFHGVWPHFLDGRTGKDISLFGRYDNGGDLVETAFLVQGLLAARGYFNKNFPAENSLRVRITKLWESVEWDWYRRSKTSAFLFWHSSPDHGFRMNHKLIGFNETMAAYLLAIASPTHPVPPSLYYSGWASQAEEAKKDRRGWGETDDGDLYSNGKSYFGIQLNVGVGPGGPLFFTDYSYLGFDPHDLTDRYTNYFENNRAMALINHAYAVANPNQFPGYGDQCWGLTASDDPWGYSAHQPVPKDDNGTISPTAALSSFPYTPEESMKALKFFYRDLGEKIWGIYGFRDAFNTKEDWAANTFLGLDQAPIAVMIENYRSGLLWKAFMANPEIRPSLERIGVWNSGPIKKSR
jgi:hypothetical protein